MQGENRLQANAKNKWRAKSRKCQADIAEEAEAKWRSSFPIDETYLSDEIFSARSEIGDIRHVSSSDRL